MATIITQIVVLSENRCHSMNLLSFASSFIFLSLRKITWLNSQDFHLRTQNEEHSDCGLLSLASNTPGLNHVFFFYSSSFLNENTFWIELKVLHILYCLEFYVLLDVTIIICQKQAHFLSVQMIKELGMYSFGKAFTFIKRQTFSKRFPRVERIKRLSCEQ